MSVSGKVNGYDAQLPKVYIYMHPISSNIPLDGHRGESYPHTPLVSDICLLLAGRLLTLLNLGTIHGDHTNQLYLTSLIPFENHGLRYLALQEY